MSFTGKVVHVASNATSSLPGVLNVTVALSSSVTGVSVKVTSFPSPLCASSAVTVVTEGFSSSPVTVMDMSPCSLSPFTLTTAVCGSPLYT